MTHFQLHCLLRRSYTLRPVNESESERDLFRERATIHTSEPKQAKFKRAHEFFLRETACNVLRVSTVVEAPVCLSVRQSHCTIVS